MKKFLVALATLLISIIAVCAKNVDYTVKVSPFNEIDVSSGITVNFTQGALKPVAVSVKQELREKLEIKVVDNTLKIKFNKPVRMLHSGDVVITVQTPSIKEVNVDSGSSFSAPSIMGSKFSLEVGSGASVNIKEIEATTSEIESASGASVKVGSFKGNKLSVEASSGASTSVAMISAHEVEAEASSGASLTLKGKATKGELEASSGASLSASGLVLEYASGSCSSGASMNYNAARSTINSKSARNHAK